MTTKRCPDCGEPIDGIGVHCRQCLLDSLRRSRDRGHLFILDMAGSVTSTPEARVAADTPKDPTDG